MEFMTTPVYWGSSASDAILFQITAGSSVKTGSAT